MAGFPRRGNESARVYNDLKRRLTAYELPPGKPLTVRIIAETLHVSVGPVRKACRQLVGEGWAIGADSHHFLAWHPDENIRVGLYESTEELLIAALNLVNVGVPASEERLAAVKEVYDELPRQAFSDDAIAFRNAELFLAIIAPLNSERAENLMRANNESMHYLRMLENRYLDDVARDLTRICELTLASRQAELKLKIHEYHRKRYDWLPNLIRLVAAN